MISALQAVNDSAEAILAGLAPAVAKRRRPSRAPADDAIDAGPDDDADAVLD